MSSTGALNQSTNRPGSAADNPTVPLFTHASETEERMAADRRGREIRQTGKRPTPLPPEHADPRIINAAVAALAEGVRDYAIFFMNPEGIIIYWGTGAHLMKWWTKEEAEGAHLRLLYPEGGSQDGTAEEHLRDAAAAGESVSQGERVRRGGSTFWAHITLTALYDPQGTLLGFAKVTQDLSQRRATEAAVALANEAQSTREAALKATQQAEAARKEAEEGRERAESLRERAEQAAEFARQQHDLAQARISTELEPALAAEQAQSAALGAEVDAYVQMFAHREREEKERKPKE
jgi:PAS domain S-box-containing protein